MSMLYSANLALVVAQYYRALKLVGKQELSHAQWAVLITLTCEETRLAAAEVHERPNEDDAGR